MTYRGHVNQGAIVLDDPVDLPDGAVVAVEILPVDKSEPLHPDIRRFTGILPKDMDVREACVDAALGKHA